MAVSEVKICNDALGLVGANFITSLNDDVKEAILCKEQYEKARDQLLSSHPWNFAITRVNLAADADLPIGWENNREYSSAFTLPAGCLRVIKLDDSESAWSMESGKLFANYAPVTVTFVKKQTDTTLFTPYFEKALAYELAVKIAYAITQSAAALTQLITLRDSAVAEARSFDGQEGSTQVVEASDFINSRY